MTEETRAGMTQQGSVLVAEDHPAIRKILLQTLRDHGWHAEETEDGFQALARLQHGGFDVIVTDYRMPGLDGLALLRKIWRMERPVPVVIHSAQTEPRVVAQLRGAGAFRILTKGCDLTDLVQSVEEACWAFKHPPARCA